MKKLLSLLLALTLSFSLCACQAKELVKKSYVEKSEEEKRFTFTFNAFDTVCSITLYGDTVKDIGNSIAQELTKIVMAYEKTFSKTVTNSDIYMINHRESNEVMVSDLTATLLDVSKGFYDWTEGRFDVSSGTLIDLWDIKNRKTVPSLSEINEARKHCGNFNYDIELDEESEDLLCNKITFNGDSMTQFDLGALVKGYVCDSLKEIIKENDAIDAAIINLGGNVCCVGELTDRKGGAFNVGIFKPFAENEIIEKVKVKDRCVITSGNYERYFKVEGDDTIYHHILDPKTGYPADTGLNSVTIISENGLLGDFLSTACFLLGEEKAKVLIDFCSKQFGDKNIQAIFIDKNNKITKYPKKAKTY